MKRLSKDLADKMVMEVLISLSKKTNASSDFAKVHRPWVQLRAEDLDDRNWLFERHPSKAPESC